MRHNGRLRKGSRGDRTVISPRRLAADGRRCGGDRRRLVAPRHRRGADPARRHVHARRARTAAARATAGVPTGRRRHRRRQLHRRRGARRTRHRRGACRHPPAVAPVAPDRDPRPPRHAATVAALGRGLCAVGGQRVLGASSGPSGACPVALPPDPSLLSPARLAGAEPAPPDRPGRRPRVHLAAGARPRLRRAGGRQLLRPEADPGSPRPRQRQMAFRVARAGRRHAVLPSLASQRRARHLEQQLRRHDPRGRLAVRHAPPSGAVASFVRLRRRDPRRRLRRPTGVTVDGPARIDIDATTRIAVMHR